MNIIAAAILVLSCTVARGDVTACITSGLAPGEVAGEQIQTPEFTGASLDVVLTADAALVWDVNSNTILYEKNADKHRPVASLSKLISVLTVRELLPLSSVVEIPTEARTAQLRGANIQLPIGQHAQVDDLLAASLIPSANDAMVTLAVAASGSEDLFVERTNSYVTELGLHDTRLANSTGLSGGDQYSTARDMMRVVQKIMQDDALRPYLSSEGGVLYTTEGASRSYKTTNKLLGTYVPILAAKTGYTVEAGQNLAIITEDASGHTIGAVVLGSDQRFQDMKILVEWIWRNYTWPK